MELTTNYKLKKPAQTDAYNVDDRNHNWDILDGKIKEIEDRFVEGVTVSTETLLKAVNWQGNKYSYETTYPSKDFNITIEPGGDLCTKEDIKMFAKRMIKGDADINEYKALGEIPRKDIPIILSVTKKFKGVE